MVDPTVVMHAVLAAGVAACFGYAYLAGRERTGPDRHDPPPHRLDRPAPSALRHRPVAPVVAGPRSRRALRHVHGAADREHTPRATALGDDDPSTGEP